MNQFILLGIGMLCLAGGSVLGYLARQSIARKRIGSIESKLQDKLHHYKKERKEILDQAREKANQIVEQAQKEQKKRQERLLKAEQLLLKREHRLDDRLSDLEKREKRLKNNVAQLKKIKQRVEDSKRKSQEALEKISGLSKEKAKKRLLKSVEKEYQKDILNRIQSLEKEGQERFEKKAREVLASTVQKLAVSQAQDITTTTVSLPSDEIKGRIIGKDGRNIKAFEKATGVELIVDESPETVVISGFNPVRREIAKISLERLIKDGRIQPARIEDTVSKVQKEISNQIEKAGKTAAYNVGIVELDKRLTKLLGRLKFRQSYGQNALLHSIEVAHLAGGLASELGANAKIAKKAGLLHDIGKAVDHQVEGSHVDIGIRILEKFGVDQRVIDAMKSHHEDYPYESLEAILVQTADAISGSRPGARKDTLENYLQRLKDLEDVATSFSGVREAYAIQAGRELRVFVKPDKVDDLQAQKLAKAIADQIQAELNYPGEIKVNLIRESRIIEYAK